MKNLYKICMLLFIVISLFVSCNNRTINENMTNLENTINLDKSEKERYENIIQNEKISEINNIKIISTLIIYYDFENRIIDNYIKEKIKQNSTYNLKHIKFIDKDFGNYKISEIYLIMIFEKK